MLILNSLSNKRKFTLMWNFRAVPSLQEEWDVYVFKVKAQNTVPEIIDPVFAKTSQNARFLLSENERFWIHSVTGVQITLYSVHGLNFKCVPFEILQYTVHHGISWNFFKLCDMEFLGILSNSVWSTE
jgi:hypothetical protein